MVALLGFLQPQLSRAEVCSDIDGDNHVIKVRPVGTDGVSYSYCLHNDRENCERIGSRAAYPVSRMEDLIEKNLNTVNRYGKLEAALEAAAITLSIASWGRSGFSYATTGTVNPAWGLRGAALGADTGVGIYKYKRPNEVHMAVLQVYNQASFNQTYKWPEQCTWIYKAKISDIKALLADDLAELEKTMGDFTPTPTPKPAVDSDLIVKKTPEAPAQNQAPKAESKPMTVGHAN